MGGGGDINIPRTNIVWDMILDIGMLLSGKRGYSEKPPANSRNASASGIWDKHIKETCR